MIRFVGTAQQDNTSLLYYVETQGKNMFFQVVKSTNGFEFSDKSTYAFIRDNKLREEQQYELEGFRVTKVDNEYFLTYKSAGNKNPHLVNAISSDGILWQQIGTVPQITETACVVNSGNAKNQLVMYFGEKDISVAYSTDRKEWTFENKPVLQPSMGNFDNGPLTVGNAYNTPNGILLLYTCMDKVGAALFDKKNPSRLVSRLTEPLWEKPEELANEHLHFFGSALFGNELVLYFLVNDKTIFSVACPLPSFGPTRKHFSAHISKHSQNPIIAPRPDKPWESRATFNSAALFENGKVHFLYRALGDKDLSVLGYATSSDGLSIDERSDEPAYIPREPFETPGGNAFSSFAQHFASGGGYGGIEDPRITKVDDKVYLTYVAFDGATPPRSAMSNIPVEDFLKKKWDKWEKPKLISAPGMVNKSVVIFPRKVQGKYVVLHRVYPNILVDYLDNLEFNNYLQGHYFIPPRKRFWDSKKVGAGAPPMETKDGWLLIYQSVGHQDPSRYKIGAMMLDRNNPSKVLYRTHTPIIEPIERYENDGFKSGVVYPCGAVIMNDTLRIYYGGADTVVCAASAHLPTFLDAMKHNREPKLRQVTSRAFN